MTKDAVYLNGQFFMETIPSCLTVNKLQVFSTTKLTFILIQFITLKRTLHVSAYTQAILRYFNTNTIQRKRKLKSKRQFFAVTIFVTLKQIILLNKSVRSVYF
jgi:hypothetical protein